MFLARTGEFCGNYVLEAEEECDCGFVSDCPDCCNCCVGRTANVKGACMLKPGKICE